MRKIMLALLVLVLLGSQAFADGLGVEVCIPVENEGLEGMYVLEMDGRTVDRIKLAKGERGELKVVLDTLDDYELFVWQLLPNEEDSIIYDDAYYKLKVTVLLSDDGEPTYHFAAEKEGEDGKAAHISFRNYKPAEETPKTGDDSGMEFYILLAALSAAVCLATVFWGRKKSRA